MYQLPSPRALAIATCVLGLTWFLPRAQGASDCGGDGERACCTTCGETASGNSKSCENGLIEAGNCPGNCTCGGNIFGCAGVASSIGKCLDPHCGGDGERACCAFKEQATTSSGGPCDSGLKEDLFSGCSGNCDCKGGPGSSIGECYDPTDCGDEGERACCIGFFEYAPGGGSCKSGLVEKNGCSGKSCRCGGSTAAGELSDGKCIDVACGDDGERGCCVGAEQASKPFSGPCKAGLVEDLQSGCSGDCFCTNSDVFKSSGICKSPSHCGGDGERACCIGLLEFASGGLSCGPGTVEDTGCSGDCLCGGATATGQKATGTCKVPECGAEGQRGCCFGEERIARGLSGPCENGLVEDTYAGCSGGNCGCLGAATSSSGICKAPSPCGGEGERACCVGVLEYSNKGTTCDSGLVEVAGCSGGDCLCGGATAIGQKSLGRCVDPECGGQGERGCCFGAERIVEGLSGPCKSGLIEDLIAGCSGIDCNCKDGPFSSSGICIDPTGCGGEGQRACCTGVLEYAKLGGASCDPGLVEIAGCAGDCKCGGLTAIGEVALGTCYKPTHCGGRGERGCCTAVFEYASQGGFVCEPGLVELPGCSGDCFCGGQGASGQVSTGMCTKLEDISEPGTQWTAPASAPTCPMRGYADMHLHLFADQAHGGGVLHGAPYDPDGSINAALQQDYGTDLDLVTKDGKKLPSMNDAIPPYCPTFMGGECGDWLFHGDHTAADDAVGFGTNDNTQSNLGVPIFNGWPRWSTTTHQQSYWKWLERAWRGGMRLTVMLGVTNEAMCKGNKRIKGTDCEDSMAPIDAQLQEAFDFETWLDEQYGGPGKGWFRIVTTPGEAREAIAAGKLAVVLGIEVDNLFNCKFQDIECTQQYVQEQLDSYWELGARHFFPVHNFDNAFGGSATWQDAINVGNKISEGHWWDASECGGKGYGFALSYEMNALIAFLGFGQLTAPDPYVHNASCNVKGMSEVGLAFIQMLMDKGAIIDVDHMSIQSFNDVMEIVEAADYPVVASHVQFFDLHKKAIRHERMRTFEQLEAIRDVGGMIAAMLKDDVQDTSRGGEKWNVTYGNSVADDCRHSSKTWAQAYLYAVDTMQGAVAFGSDFNGVAGHSGPRFGNEACGNNAKDRSRQLRESQRMEYPFTLPGFGTFDKQKTGDKTFDYNTDGLAHVGLLPDMIADLKTVGLADYELDPLWRSAEAYIEVWERALGEYRDIPPATCADVVVDSVQGCSAAASIAADGIVDDLRITATQSPAGPYPVGDTTVELTVVDLCGGAGTSTCTATVTVVDGEPPAVTCQADQTLECVDGGALALLEPATATDTCGTATVLGCNAPADARFSMGTTKVTCVAVDEQDNAGTCSHLVHVQDTAPPQFASPNDVTVECTAAHGHNDNLAAPVASDACEGALAATLDDPTPLGVGTHTVSWTAHDASGNSAAATQVVHVVDTTPPAIASTTASPATLWPADQAMVTVHIAADVSDACDASASCSVTGVTANEPLGTGDWALTGPLSVELRASRDPAGNGRVYVLALSCADGSGHASTAAVNVAVPIGPPGGLTCTEPLGDVDGNGATNIVDVQCAILVALWTGSGYAGPPPTCAGALYHLADANCDQVVTVSDVQICVLRVLGQPLSAAIDHDGDGCPSACENVCDAGAALCDDGVACTEDGCDPESGCTHTPVDTACSDGNPCTRDVCDAASGCAAVPGGCDDSDPCTEDACIQTSPSAKSCTQLGWSPGPGSAAVCGGTSSVLDPLQNPPVPACQPARTFAQAAQACALTGARLCTVAELEADETNFTGCNFGSHRVWSSSSCGAGQVWTAAGASGSAGAVPTKCTDVTVANVAVRCCADASTTPVSTCTHSPASEPCDDGIACTTDACAPGVGCVHTPNDASCADGNACTADACDPESGCVFAATEAPCDTGTPCTVGQCQLAPASALSCDELGWPELGKGSAEVCGASDAGALTCGVDLTHAQAQNHCESVGGRLCTLGEMYAGEAKGTGCSLNPLLLWTATACDGGYWAVKGSGEHDAAAPTQCAAPSTHLPVRCCADAAPAAVKATCVAVAPGCDDGVDCTLEGCDASGECVSVAAPAGQACADGDACTQQDRCAGGLCFGAASVTCADGDACTTDACHPQTGCTFTPVSCQDGNPCTAKSCQAAATSAQSCAELGWSNAAQYGSAEVCGESNHNGMGGSCSGDVQHAAAAQFCESTGARLCTISELQADETRLTGCSYDQRRVWSSSLCTEGAYWTAAGAANFSNAVPLACTPVGSAKVVARCCADVAPAAPTPGVCVATSPTDCDDGDACTTDHCKPAAGCVHSPVDCEDGDLCTENTCSQGGCLVAAAVVCDDDNPCTDDTCHSGVGCEFTANAALCDDGNACTLNDQCMSGECSAGLIALSDALWDAELAGDGEVEFYELWEIELDTLKQSQKPAFSAGQAAVGLSSANAGNALTLKLPLPASTAAATVAAHLEGQLLGGSAVYLFFEDIYGYPHDIACLTSEEFGSAGYLPSELAEIPYACPDTGELINWNFTTQAPTSFVPVALHLRLFVSGSEGDSFSLYRVGVTGVTQADLLACDDGDACTDDFCIPANGCVSEGNQAPCETGDLCTVDRCGAVPTSAESCDSLGWLGSGPSDPVCAQSARPDGTCSGHVTHAQAGAYCDALGGRLCTVAELESNQTGGSGCGYNDDRVWTAIPCGPSSYWTAAGLSGFAGSIPTECTPATTPLVVARCCADAHPEAPALGCHAVQAEPCNDGIACTLDGCDPETGCVHTANPGACDDLNACTTDVCNASAPPGSTGCTNTASLAACDDVNACTVSTCSPPPTKSMFSCAWHGWGAGFGSPNVCAMSKRPDGTCVGSVPYSTAKSFCAVLGARLCTVTELAHDEARGTGCSLDFESVWSSTPCGASGHAVIAGASYNLADHPIECMGADDGQGEAFVRCCADANPAGLVAVCTPGSLVDCDDGVACTADSCDPYTGCQHLPVNEACDDGDACTTDICDPDADAGGCTNTIVGCDDGNACTLAGCAVPATSGASCAELGWAAGSGSPDVCAESDGAPLPGCSGFVSHDDAIAFCEGAGARLCTVNELVAKEAQTTGCSYDVQQVWSATPCGGGGGGAAFATVLGKPANSATPIECAAQGELRVARCCADAAPASAVAGCYPLEVDPCHDGDVCTSKACDPAVGCTFDLLVGMSCDDGKECTVNTTCNAAGDCAGGSGKCDDGIACTQDLCGIGGVCANLESNALCGPGTICSASCGGCVPATAPCSTCGNGVCDSSETKTSCPADCDPKPPLCGNGNCGPGETLANCPEDCGGQVPSCGNGTCEPGESAATCPQDCSGTAPCTVHADCNDGNPATSDFCSLGGVCIHM